MSNVEYTYPENNVEYDNPVEGFDYSIRQTYVWYKKADNHGSVKYFGPVLPVWKIPGNVDTISMSEIFDVLKHHFNETDDGISVSEVFDVRKTQEVLEIFSSQVDISEEFSTELIEPERRFPDDSISINEEFLTELIEPERRFPQDEVNLSEIFNLESVFAEREDSLDSVSISEIFNSTKVSAINKFTSDNLSLSEIFSKTHKAFGDVTSVTAEHLFVGTNDISWTYDGDGDPDHFELQGDVGAGYQVIDNNINGSNRSYGHSGCGSFYSNNDIVRYRVRAATSGGGLSDWEQSNTVTIENC